MASRPKSVGLRKLFPANPTFWRPHEASAVCRVSSRFDGVLSTNRQPRDQAPHLVIEAIAEELGISPIPVREAIRRLEPEGWVKHRPHIGPEVAPIVAEDWLQALEVMSVLEGRVPAARAGGAKRKTCR
jgi:DNA-binding transcriptional regulator YhcF (GntR family)